MIFDPNAGSGSVLVATIASTQDATIASRRYDDDREEYEQAMRLRDMRELGFGQRQSVCG